MKEVLGRIKKRPVLATLAALGTLTAGTAVVIGGEHLANDIDNPTYVVPAGSVIGAQLPSADGTPNLAVPAPSNTDTIGAAIKGHVIESKQDGGNVNFGYEQVQYFPNGSRDVIFYGSKKDLNDSLGPVDEFDESCTKIPFSDKPGHTLSAIDVIDRDVGQDTPKSAYCADERLTPEAFAVDPLTLGVPGFVVLSK